MLFCIFLMMSSRPNADESQVNSDVIHFFFVFLLLFFYLGFTALSSIFHIYRADHSQRWAKTRKKKHLTIRKQNLAFPRVPSKARTTVVRNLMDYVFFLSLHRYSSELPHYNVSFPGEVRKHKYLFGFDKNKHHTQTHTHNCLQVI